MHSAASRKTGDLAVMWPEVRRSFWRRPAFWTLLLTLVLVNARGETSPLGTEKFDRILRPLIGPVRQHGWTRVVAATRGRLGAHEERWLRALHVDVTRHFRYFHGFGASVPRRSLTELARLPFIVRISADAVVRKTDEFTQLASGADIAHNQFGLSGRGVGVAVLDSGVCSSTTTDPDLNGYGGKSRIVWSQNFVSGETRTRDQVGHGTFVAGVIAGNGAQSSQTSGTSYNTHTFYGIARCANIVSLRVLNGQGVGQVSDVMAAIEWAIANRDAYNIRVLNLSLGHAAGDYYQNDPLCQMCEYAWSRGIFVVVAAGNNGRLNSTPTDGFANEGYGTAYGSIASPGNDPYVITVGALKQNPADPTNRAAYRIATYSSRGPSRLDFVLKPDIVTAGNHVVSLRLPNSLLEPQYDPTNLVPVSAYWMNPPGGTQSAYFQLSGTSLSAAVVSGAAALMYQADPTLSPDTIKARMMLGADKFPENGDIFSYGAGVLNIPAALARTETATNAISPPVLRSGQQDVVLMGRVIWGANGIWNTGITDPRNFWGPGAVKEDGAIVFGRVIWGGSLWNDTTVWQPGSVAADLSQTTINGD